MTLPLNATLMHHMQENGIEQMQKMIKGIAKYAGIPQKFSEEMISDLQKSPDITIEIE